MTAVLEEKDVYLAGFAEFEKSLPSNSPWNALRHAAMDRFAALGFPTLDDEEWRFTPLSSLTRVPFQLSERPRSLPSREEIGRLTAGTGRCHLLVFVDGHYVPELSALGQLPEGVVLLGLGQALDSHRELVEPHLARYADSESQPFVALNTAFLPTGHSFTYRVDGWLTCRCSCCSCPPHGPSRWSVIPATS